MIRTKISFLDRYVIMMSLIPILQSYGFKTFPWITFADIWLIIFLIAFFLKDTAGNRCEKNICILIIYILAQAVITVALDNSSDIVDTLGTAARLSLLMLPVGLVIPNNSDNYTVLKPFRIVGVISSFYGILQFVLGNFFRISLSPYIPFLPILRIGMDTQQLGWINYGWLVRARSWFPEPASFAIYLLLVLSMELFILKDIKKIWMTSLIYICGIFVANSSLGTMGLLIIVFFVLLNWFFTRKKHISKMIAVLLIIFIPIIVLFVIKTGYIGRFMEHTFVNGSILQQSHFATVGNVFKSESNIMQIIFGHGLQQIDDNYLPGWIRIYYALGIIGIFLYLVFFIDLFRKSSSGKRSIILLFVILNIGTEIIVGCYFLLFVSLLALLNEEESCNTNIIERGNK